MTNIEMSTNLFSLGYKWWGMQQTVSEDHSFAGCLKSLCKSNYFWKKPQHNWIHSFLRWTNTFGDTGIGQGNSDFSEDAELETVEANQFQADWTPGSQYGHTAEEAHRLQK